jgi:hypothetical protein
MAGRRIGRRARGVRWPAVLADDDGRDDEDAPADCGLT